MSDNKHHINDLQGLKHWDLEWRGNCSQSQLYMCIINQKHLYIELLPLGPKNAMLLPSDSENTSSEVLVESPAPVTDKAAAPVWGQFSSWLLQKQHLDSYKVSSLGHAWNCPEYHRRLAFAHIAKAIAQNKTANSASAANAGVICTNTG